MLKLLGCSRDVNDKYLDVSVVFPLVSDDNEQKTIFDKDAFPFKVIYVLDTYDYMLKVISVDYFCKLLDSVLSESNFSSDKLYKDLCENKSLNELKEIEDSFAYVGSDKRLNFDCVRYETEYLIISSSIVHAHIRAFVEVYKSWFVCSTACTSRQLKVRIIDSYTFDIFIDSTERRDGDSCYRYRIDTRSGNIECLEVSESYNVKDLRDLTVNDTTYLDRLSYLDSDFADNKLHVVDFRGSLMSYIGKTRYNKLQMLRSLKR